MSNSDPAKCPAPTLPEYAFIGRSNVGKSSLINMLTDRKKLAKISGRPGKTQLINHFLINENWYLVDLPGYGYASTSKKNRKAWQQFIEKYLRERQNLLCTFVLIDSRHDPQRIDLEFMEWMAVNELPFVLVFTKGDKHSKTALKRQIASYEKKLGESWEELPPRFVTSGESGLGREDVLAYIAEVNTLFQ